jgi:hypothetical protein
MIDRAARVAAVLIASALLACSAGRDAPPEPAAFRPVESADDATRLVSAAIRRSGLTSLRDDCLQYSVRPDAGDFVVDVRESHQRPQCQGDPQTAPHLFDVRVNRLTGAMTTNANAAPDAFHPLPPNR